MLHIPFMSDPATFLTVQGAGAEAFLLEVLTQLGAGAALLTEEGTAVFWNARAASLTGYGLPEINTIGLVHVFEPPQRMAHLVAQAKGGVPSIGERLLIHHGAGGRRPVAVWCLPLHREDNAKTRVIVAIREEQAADHAERIDAQERLQILGQLAGAVSHEIQNPLNAISLHTDVLEEELAQPDGGNRAQLLDSLGVVRARMGHLQELVQEYLTLARLAVLPREPEDLGGLLEALALEMRDILTARGVALRLEDVTGLGQAALHKSSFGRALRKMVQHVLDTMPQGGRLTIRGRRTATQIHLDICEANRGAATGQAVLQPPPVPTTEPAKAELGLSLVREVIVAHQGDIMVRHEPGVGTTFTVTLPLLAAGEAQEE